jgi:photosystem II stability/assembly factor-like uncharacterized protein
LAALFFFFAPAAARAAEVPLRYLLLDGMVVGPDVIVVGESGVILRSSDQARTWTPAASGVKCTLTGVSFATLTAPKLGWIVGHDAVILGTNDGGVTWTKQYQGENLQASFLDVLAVDAQRAIAVGADGLYVSTTNGGKTWEKRRITEDEYHFNRITRGSSSTLFIAGEHGTLLRSPDLGATWTSLKTPYEGSFYGILMLDRQTLLAYGLRGHVYRSTDDGASWRQIETPRAALLATALKVGGANLVLAGQARTVLVSRDLGRTLTRIPNVLGTGVAEMLELPDGAVLALGEAGATRVEPSALWPAPAAAPAPPAR